MPDFKLVANDNNKWTSNQRNKTHRLLPTQPQQPPLLRPPLTLLPQPMLLSSKHLPKAKVAVHQELPLQQTWLHSLSKFKLFSLPTLPSKRRSTIRMLPLPQEPQSNLPILSLPSQEQQTLLPSSKELQLLVLA